MNSGKSPDPVTVDGEISVAVALASLTVSLPTSAWSVVLGYLRAGTYQHVNGIIDSILQQISPQIEAIEKSVAATAAAIPEQTADRNGEISIQLVDPFPAAADTPAPVRIH